MAPPTVTLVIPGRNCEATLPQCLAAVSDIRDRSSDLLRRIIFVDDASTDSSRNIAADFPVEIIPGPGRGPAAARNLGIARADTELVWFVDSDCVSEPDALERLLPHMRDPAVAGVSGSYGMMNPSSLLATLIHEEIIQRHIRMAGAQSVDFLATFNVLYRRQVLLNLGGFDERYRKAQDAELSFRVLDAGHRLAFEFDSRVNHFHEERWFRYFSTQRQQGFWRVFLHMEHRGREAGDSYSSALDHLQPVVALLALALAPLLTAPLWAHGAAASLWTAPVGLLTLLLLTQIPMTSRLLARTRRPKLLAFAWMSALRAVFRGVGMAHGLLVYVGERKKREREARSADPVAAPPAANAAD